MSEEKKKRDKSENGQWVCVEFENFQVVGVRGGFAIRHFKVDYIWDEKKQDYITRNVPGGYAYGTAWTASLHQVLKYIHRQLWNQLKIGAGDNTVDTFEELLCVSRSIDKRLDEFGKKLDIEIRKAIDNIGKESS